MIKSYDLVIFLCSGSDRALGLQLAAATWRGSSGKLAWMSRYAHHQPDLPLRVLVSDLSLTRISPRRGGQLPSQGPITSVHITAKIRKIKQTIENHSRCIVNQFYCVDQYNKTQSQILLFRMKTNYQDTKHLQFNAGILFFSVLFCKRYRGGRGG